jgi:hypothetical protein
MIDPVKQKYAWQHCDERIAEDERRRQPSPSRPTESGTIFATTDSWHDFCFVADSPQLRICNAELPQLRIEHIVADPHRCKIATVADLQRIFR